jgi:tRNA nucleotidyltransferase (CCA-adding enzyme)
VPQPPQWHPEIDTGLHTLMVLDQATMLSEDTRVRFAALVHVLGKGTTPRAEWPSHRGHEERGVALIDALATRLRLPGDYRDLALIVARHHGNVHRACEADARGRTGLETQPYPQRAYVLAARAAAAAIKPSAEDLAHSGPRIAELIHERRIHAIAALRP